MHLEEGFYRHFPLFVQNIYFGDGVWFLSLSL
jgi:hypothetical protein